MIVVVMVLNLFGAVHSLYGIESSLYRKLIYY